MSNGKIITSTEVRLSFEHLLTPQAQKNDDGTMSDPLYSTMLLIPKSDAETVEGIKTAINEALQKGVSEKWNGKRPSGLRNPLRDGDEELNDEGLPKHPGFFFLNAKGPRGGAEPAFLYAKNGRLVTAQDRDATEIVYSGAYGRVSLNFYAYDRMGNKGVGAGIVAFLSGEHGERLDSRPTATSALGEFGLDPFAEKQEALVSAPQGQAQAIDADEDPWG